MTSAISDNTPTLRMLREKIESLLEKQPGIREHLFEEIMNLIEELHFHKRSLENQNETLEQRVEERTAELEKRARLLQQLSIRLYEAEDNERERIAQLLHDDLQQHLATVKLKLEMLLYKNGSQQAATNEIDNCVSLLSEAMNKTRNLSSSLSPPVLRRSGLLAALDQLTEDMKKKYNLDVKVSKRPEAEPKSRATAAFLYQALNELLFNVAKHSGVQEAFISIQEKDNWIIARVRDAGKGDSLDNVYAKRGVEPGFGLFSIEERIGYLGGNMTIETIPGDGWITTLTIPKDAAETKDAAIADAAFPSAAALSDDSSENEPGNFEKEEKIRVMVVDDHELMREGLSGLLNEQKNFWVVGQAANGQEAISLAETCRPDVILMDVAMPEMDGVAATATIHLRHPDFHIIGLSMYEDPLTRESMLDAGAVDFVCKSDSTKTIVDAVMKASSS